MIFGWSGMNTLGFQTCLANMRTPSMLAFEERASCMKLVTPAERRSTKGSIGYATQCDEVDYEVFVISCIL